MQIVGARAGLGEPIARLLAAGDDDHRRDASPVQIDRVIEPRREHRRRPAVVLRGAEHDDRLRRPRVVAARRHPHLHEGRPTRYTNTSATHERDATRNRDLEQRVSRAGEPRSRPRAAGADCARAEQRDRVEQRQARSSCPRSRCTATCITLPGFSPSSSIDRAQRRSRRVHSHVSTYAITASSTSSRALRGQELFPTILRRSRARRRERTGTQLVRRSARASSRALARARPRVSNTRTSSRSP